MKSMAVWSWFLASAIVLVTSLGRAGEGYQNTECSTCPPPLVLPPVPPACEPRECSLAAIMENPCLGFDLPSYCAPAPFPSDTPLGTNPPKCCLY
ncbi:MAG: hypothetical protein AB1486_18470, partial [Planctomycetota bacterium]